MRSCPKPPDAAHIQVLLLPLTASPLHSASLFPQAIATGGHNNGRVGTIVHKEKHKGSFDIVHIKDAGAHAWDGGRLNSWAGMLLNSWAGMLEGQPWLS